MIRTDDLHFKSITFAGVEPGPRLVVTGAVHGNETCGTRAILRALDDIETKRLAIAAGSVTFVPVTNPLAYAKGERAGDRNLNRNLAPSAQPRDFEDRVANWLCPLLERHDVLLDLHSTRARNTAFAMLGPRDNEGPLEPFHHEREERSLAVRLGVRRFVDGWMAAYAQGVAARVERQRTSGAPASALNTDPKYGVGTTEFMRSRGGYAVTVECGQHEDPQAPEVGYRAIVNALAHLGLVRATAPAPAHELEYLTLCRVTDRLHSGDAFSRAWASFDRVQPGDRIGTRHDGTPVLAQVDGFILFPDAQALPGNEWFYEARARAPAELLTSSRGGSP